jgi:CheY-like chemotaxis protein
LARKILLADDSVTAQNMGRKILADAGYDVVTVNNGSAALKRISEINPDLIVLDVYMPGYSGLEVCQRLKDAEETAHLPVLLTVGKLEPFKAEDARRVRADGHIVKPFEASELLTAITRLEDSVVPQAEAGRIRSEASGRKPEVNSSADNGWKSRLGFSTKKKKEEKEPVATGGSFRDFRKGKSKPAVGEAEKVSQGQKGQGQLEASEPVRDIPRDITPEEMDALSALAAKLNKSNAPAESIAPPAVMPVETAEPLSAPALEVAEAKSENKPENEAQLEAAPKSEARAFVVVAERSPSLAQEVQTPSLASEPPVAAAEVPAFVVTGSSEIEIPVEHVEQIEAVAETASPATDSMAGEATQHGTAEEQPSAVAENQAAENHFEPSLDAQDRPAEAADAPVVAGAFVTVTAPLVQEPASVDLNDEPRFAAASNAVEPVAQTVEGHTEVAPSAEVSQVVEPTETFAATGAVASTYPETPREGSETQFIATQDFAGQASNPDELSANFAHSVPLAAAAPTMEAPEGPAPTDEELTQALRLLTPSNGNTEPKPFSSHESLSAAGQQLAEEVVRSAEADSSQGRSRWMAQPVAITPEEAALSLEAEMFRTFAVGITGRLAAGRNGEVEPLRISGVSAIAAAVENRLAAAESAASSNPALEAAITAPSDSPDEASAATQAAVLAETEKATATFAEALTQQLTQDAIAREADAPNAVEATANSSADTTAEPTAAIAEVDTPDANSQIEADESMRKDKDKDKDAKSKSAKSKAQQVETVAVAAVSSDEAAMAEAPKAMAAAANGEAVASSASSSNSTAAASSSTSGPDAGTIASIVESVMADLRPKIVEEIVKKLAGK